MKNIVEYLEFTANRVPNKIAVIDEHKEINYKDFLTLSQHLGSYLAKTNDARTPVIVFMEKGVDALSCFMGAAYARCFYVFIDPGQHPKRIQQILDITEAKYLISNDSTLPEEASFKGEIIEYKTIKDYGIDKDILSLRQSQALDIDPLYCNFTSGTTGIPKGVIVAHRSVIDFINPFTEIFNIDENDVIGNQAPFDFDVSVKDIYSALKVGATLVVIPKKYFSVIMNLMDYLEKHSVTTLIWAVSAVNLIVQFKGFSYKVPTTLNKVMFSGEKMPIPMLNKWKKVLPDVMYVNLYGPTEITCNCTYHIIPQEFDEDYVMPTGIPFPNEQIILLDENNKEVIEVKALGEICVAGTALALGYYKNPEQTSKAFCQNPLNPNFPQRIYRTGDIGYLGEDGLYYFAGRKDFQIKHMGHRIELEEIETASYTHPEIKQICCVYNEKRHQIIACYSGEVTPDAMKAYLLESLPRYMVPNKFIQLDTLPLNANGKLNRKLIKETYGG